ncbi:MAG: rod shape-determining protein [Candidatus Kaiserbacteria bacterium]|nr:rod shape-determining protein [Candidatus Kaiserbacteria bacterium]
MSIFSFSRDVGVDFGTSRTRIFVPYKGIVFDEPSVVALDEKSKELLCMGNYAKEMEGRTIDGVVVTPMLSNGVVQDERIAEQYLRSGLKRSYGLFSTFSVLRHDVLVNVPTNTTSMEERAVIQTCKRAGVRNVFAEKSAILAALGIGTPRDELRGRMVVDIGAGLTEAAVISLGGMSSSSTIKVGGDDVDWSIVQYIQERHQLFISKETAREVKEKVGSVVTDQSPAELKVKGNDTQSRLPRVVVVTSNDIADAIYKEVEGILKTIESVFQSTPPELTSDIIDRGIVLTGGMAKLRGIDVAIEKHINVPVQVANDPEHAVIRGIGRSIQTGHLDFHKQAILTQ